MNSKRMAWLTLTMMVLIFLTLILSLLAYTRTSGSSVGTDPELKAKIVQLEERINALEPVPTPEPVKEPEKEPEKEPAKEPTKKPDPVKPAVKTYTTTSNDVTLRAKPSMTIWVVDTLPKGTKLTYLNETKEAEGYTWYKVKQDNEVWGWVASKFVK